MTRFRVAFVWIRSIPTAHVTRVACPYKELTGGVFIQAFMNQVEIFFLRQTSEVRKKRFRRNFRKCSRMRPIVLVTTEGIILCIEGVVYNMGNCVFHFLQRRLHSGGDEVHLAVEAQKRAKSNAPTIFSKIIERKIPADIIYEDDKVKQKPVNQ